MAVLALLYGDKHRKPWRPLGWFAGYMFLDVALTMGCLPANASWLGLEFNWIGKAACVAVGLLFVAFGPLGRTEVGLCMPTTWRGSFYGILVVLVLAGVFLMPDPQANGESLLYQMSMPGLAEELTYRGILLAFLLRCYGSSASGKWRAALVTSFAFACIHDLDLQSGHLVWPMMPFLYHFAMGLFFAWIRLATGSLLVPVLAHNAGNTAQEVGYLWRIVR